MNINLENVITDKNREFFENATKQDVEDFLRKITNSLAVVISGEKNLDSVYGHAVDMYKLLKVFDKKIFEMKEKQAHSMRMPIGTMYIKEVGEKAQIQIIYETKKENFIKKDVIIYKKDLS